MSIRVVLVCIGLMMCVATGAAAQIEKQGVTYRSAGGTTLRLILDDTNVGSEVSLGEITFPPNLDSGEHTARSRCSWFCRGSSSTL